ncbi:NADH:ubiquinone oxidoreductase subunit 3 (chain A) [Thiovulum sp. ES]|nr:NADH:ubiquinone oxidoreductase subunit 3 (chain A) [Thiovulum sp. ES]
METLLIFMFLTFVGIVLLYFLGVSVAPYRPNRVKTDHFECGLPPSSETPQKINFSYFVFAIFFIAVDTAGLFFSVLLFDESVESLTYLAIFSLILGISISIAMKEYNKGSK